MLTIFEPRCENIFFLFIDLSATCVYLSNCILDIYRENGLDFFAKVAPILLYFIFQAQLQCKVNLP